MTPVNNKSIELLITQAQQVTLPADFAQQTIPLLDLTSLNQTDTPEIIGQLCKQATTRLGNVAAVCIYPQFVEQAKKHLKNTAIKIATVANFPAGGIDLKESMKTIKKAIADGADEIDVVMPYSAYLAGDDALVQAFIRACKQTCGPDIFLKVILETGILQKFDIIYAASLMAIEAGADFIKTSTGKTEIGATLTAAMAMLIAIKNSGKAVGFKAAGGVRMPQQAASYLYLIKEILGEAWLVPDRTRIGASSLLTELLK